MRDYLTESISFAPDESMQKGLKLYFDLAKKHGLIEKARPVRYTL